MYLNKRCCHLWLRLQHIPFKRLLGTVYAHKRCAACYPDQKFASGKPIGFIFSNLTDPACDRCKYRRLADNDPRFGHHAPYVFYICDLKSDSTSLEDTVSTALVWLYERKRLNNDLIAGTSHWVKGAKPDYVCEHVRHGIEDFRRKEHAFKSYQLPKSVDPKRPYSNGGFEAIPTSPLVAQDDEGEDIRSPFDDLRLLARPNNPVDAYMSAEDQYFGTVDAEIELRRDALATSYESLLKDLSSSHKKLDNITAQVIERVELGPDGKIANASNQQIADELGVSEGTVRNCLKNFRRWWHKDVATRYVGQFRFTTKKQISDERKRHTRDFPKSQGTGRA